MNCSLPGSSVYGNSPYKNTGVGCHVFLQGIFPTQGWNPGLPHWRQILYHLSHQGSPCWSLACKVLSMTSLAWEMSEIVQWLARSLVLPFLGTGMRVDFFQSCGHCWVFQICWHIECNTLIASPFRVLNSSTGISLHPVTLLTAVLPKAHLTSYSRMSGSGWLTTPSWLSVSLRSFLYSSSMYSFHLFLVSSTSLSFLSFIVLIFGWGVSLRFPIFLKRFLVFPLLLFSSIFMHFPLKAFLSLLAVLWNSAFSWVYLSLSPLPFASLLSSAICKTSSDNHFAFLLFCFGGWFCSKSHVQYYEPLSIVLQAHHLHLFWPQLIFSKNLLTASCLLIHWEKLSCLSRLLR